MTRWRFGSSKRTTMRVPARIGSSVVMNIRPSLILAMLRRTRDGPLLLLVNSYSTSAVMGARSNRRRSNCAELFILLLCCAGCALSSFIIRALVEICQPLDAAPTRAIGETRDRQDEQ